MKSKLTLVSVTLFILGTANAAFGNGAPACEPIKAACTKAGFQTPPHPEKGTGKEGFKAFHQAMKALREQGKDLRFNCMKPLLHGETVPGVTADPSWDLAGCKAQVKAKMEARRAKWQERKESEGKED